MLKSGVAGFEAVDSVTIVSVTVGLLFLPFVLLTLRSRSYCFVLVLMGIFLL